ncbi:MAG TPA: stage II sporulation protein M [Clostridia bacterium]
MKEDKFIKDNSEIWSEFENTLKRLKAKGIKKFSKNELDILYANYNRVSGHLSYSRTYFGNTATTSYLNRLVASAHSYIYSVKSSTVKKLVNFYVNEFPRLIRSNIVMFIISMAVFMSGAILSFSYSMYFPENTAAFIPQQELDSMNLSTSQRDADGSTTSSLILTNNIKVGFLAFALGVTLSVGTIAILFANGLPIGALAAYAMHKNANAVFWALILPHGILELFAIFVCGAAGIIIGYSIINPGKHSRKDSLVLKGKTAIMLVLGTVPIFTIAGIIEGNVTPSVLPPSLKLCFAVFTLILLVVYCMSPWSRGKGRVGEAS